MKNEELWFIKGQYRTVFDLVTEMPLPSTSKPAIVHTWS